MHLTVCEHDDILVYIWYMVELYVVWVMYKLENYHTYIPLLE